MGYLDRNSRVPEFNVLDENVQKVLKLSRNDANLLLPCKELVAVFSLTSGQKINNPWGPREGGPEGTGKGKVQSTPVPKRGTKV